MERLADTQKDDMLSYYRDRIRVLERRIEELESELHAYGVAAKHVDGLRDVK
jgi:hypothetical protein